MQRALPVLEVKHPATAERPLAVRGHICELSHEQRDLEDLLALPIKAEALCNMAGAGKTCSVQLTVRKTDLTSQSLALFYSSFLLGCMVTI